jgi:phosphodiesterase/alkaline phosphatase D-like protein
MMLRYRINVGVVGRAVGSALVAGALMASACGGPAKDEPKKERVAPPPAPLDKPEPVEMPPLPSPDCAAPVPALTAERMKVQESDGLRAPATEGPAKLNAGPILGDIGDQGVTIWISTDRTVPWRVTVLPVKGPKKKQVFTGPEPTQASDFTAAVRLDKLAPNTEYEYEVELGAGKDAFKGPKGSFHTIGAPGAPGKLRIAVGARLSAEPEQPIFAQLGEHKPDLLMLLGDQIFSGNLKANFPAYADKYQKNWSITQLKTLMQSLPTYMMWDDADIKTGYYAGSSENRYEPARLAFELYAQAHNPPPVRDGDLHFQFQAGEVSFFVMDTRSHRSDPESAESADKTMLGETQKADLARFLKCAPGKVKVIATSVAFSNQVPGTGSWRDYESERKQLISFIEREKVDNLIVLTGDQAWSALLLHNHKRTRFYELMPTPLSKELSKAPKKAAKGILARDDDNHVFGLVDIDTTVKPATITFTLCAKDKPCKPGEEKPPASALDEEGDKETVPYTFKITEDDIGPKEPEAKPAAPEKAPVHPVTGAK